MHSFTKKRMRAGGHIYTGQLNIQRAGHFYSVKHLIICINFTNGKFQNDDIVVAGSVRCMSRCGTSLGYVIIVLLSLYWVCNGGVQTPSQSISSNALLEHM